jgi:hypothetical protein
MGLKELLGRKEVLNRKADEIMATIQPQLDAVGEQLAETEREIRELVFADLTAIRKLQQKEYGAVNITLDGFRVTETIAKKVKWDQEKLFGVFHKIQSTGDNPFEWMKAEFKVGEKEYGAYPKNIQAVFAPARTVTPGDPKLEFKSVEAPDA